MQIAMWCIALFARTSVNDVAFVVAEEDAATMTIATSNLGLTFLTLGINHCLPPDYASLLQGLLSFL